LVARMRPDQARGVQTQFHWLTARSLQPGSLDAKSPLGPGSLDTAKSAVSPESGSRDAGALVLGTLRREKNSPSACFNQSSNHRFELAWIGRNMNQTKAIARDGPGHGGPGCPCTSQAERRREQITPLMAANLRGEGRWAVVGVCLAVEGEATREHRSLRRT
jgi:hypothetical protein